MRQHEILEPVRFLTLLSALTVVTAGCSASDTRSGRQQNETVGGEALDPKESHYGLTNAEWGTRWWQWIWQAEEPAGECNPIPWDDLTGEKCAIGQSGDVFFLVGTTGSTVTRDECAVPLGKAIFFPILTFNGDNGGVPEDMLVSDENLRGTVQQQMDGVPLDELLAEFDGVPIKNLARFATKLTKYNYTVPAAPNVYTCNGAMFEGLVDPAYHAGYYVMLAPPEAGHHTLHFAGHSPASVPELSLDVTYDFTIRAR